MITECNYADILLPQNFVLRNGVIANSDVQLLACGALLARNNTNFMPESLLPILLVSNNPNTINRAASRVSGDKFPTVIKCVKRQ